MPDLGPHAAFIWSAYAAVALVLAVLIGWIIADGWRQRSLLDRLERDGVRRDGKEPEASARQTKRHA
jgi:heme exporter protein D